MKKILPFSLLLPVMLPLLGFQSAVNADDYPGRDVFSIDDPVPADLNLEFDNDDDLEPKASDFKIVSSVLMSSPAGERRATITIKNTSNHQRLFDKEHIIAVFADGSKRTPFHVEHKFSGQEQVTLLLNFGLSRYPILKVIVKN